MLLVGILLLFAQVLDSRGKWLKSMEGNTKWASREMDASEETFGKDTKFKWHGLSPIEQGYNHERSSRNEWNKDKSIQKSRHKRLRRCFCGLPFGASCPDGFLETCIHWPLPIAPIVPPSFPAEGPSFDVGDEWAWLQDGYDGELEQDPYGWNWRERMNGNTHAGSQFGTQPYGQHGWCCELLTY